ncbi:2-succinyl-6-hydroxy-2,4-cyclohexadiene-1-carboxylate synthase [Streptomyces sp. RB17]|uniref:alpha/beta fold hydrolase n=1 Tax=Streptomyces sp. RB17 TaxID=2585197 RepID=UPI00129594BD|nr:alpha/beta hydrolase [Streptomyces sp. RB17]MQY39917.1 2-succinyl-6-hydroxy-2,4-cyclohexadiene-1-carboxylate synthase [Streptomyces sp. RB17]
MDPARPLPHPGFRVSAVDLPGHGALQDCAFTLAAAVRELDDAVQEAVAKTGRRPLVAGLSLGGYVALAHAVARPHHVGGLVLCSCTARPRGWKGLVYRTAARLNELMGPELSSARDARLLRRNATAECADAALAGGLAVHSFGEAVRELHQVDFLGLTARLRSPTLFVNGRSDFVFRREEADFVAAARRAGTQAELLHQRGGHIFLMQHRERFAALLDRVHEGFTGNH